MEDYAHGPEALDEQDSEIGSASSSSSSSSESDAAEEELHCKSGHARGIEIPGPLYQNNKSKVLRKVGDIEGTSKCGIHTGEKFTVLLEGAPLKWARCSKCFKGETINTAEAAVAMLDALRMQRGSNQG